VCHSDSHCIGRYECHLSAGLLCKFLFFQFNSYTKDVYHLLAKCNDCKWCTVDNRIAKFKYKNVELEYLNSVQCTWYT